MLYRSSYVYMEQFGLFLTFGLWFGGGKDTHQLELGNKKLLVTKGIARNGAIGHYECRSWHRY